LLFDYREALVAYLQVSGEAMDGIGLLRRKRPPISGGALHAKFSELQAAFDSFDHAGHD